ncbi:hypothetical protein ACFYT4_30895 [Streptomyces sp. NPDC004609]|uniref:hypothetical protein n=1 Tax=Streptomyces sp. NPDC004609 TaxID=3364704 RepID=UPI00367972A1
MREGLPGGDGQVAYTVPATSRSYGMTDRRIDNATSRPGRIAASTDVVPTGRATLAEEELDELPDGSHEIGVIEWVDYRKTAELPIFPPMGPAPAALPHPRAAVADAALDAVTDENYTWV